MTRLVYTIGNKEVRTLKEAKQISAETGIPYQPKYVPIYGPSGSHIDAEKNA